MENDRKLQLFTNIQVEIELLRAIGFPIATIRSLASQLFINSAMLKSIKIISKF